MGLWIVYICCMIWFWEKALLGVVVNEGFFVDQC